MPLEVAPNDWKLKTLAMLESFRGRWRQIEANSNLKYEQIQAIAQERAEDPGCDRINHLHNVMVAMQKADREEAEQSRLAS